MNKISVKSNNNKRYDKSFQVLSVSNRLFVTIRSNLNFNNIKTYYFLTSLCIYDVYENLLFPFSTNYDVKL